ncbi:glutamate 5-kinase [Candidatus Peregrinibacteria bacterium]|nr:glutamate 5-kinase [Candidatus Peregrinibacteria bacterium]
MRLVLKIGTSLVTREDHTLDTAFLRDMVRQIAALVRQKHQIIIVTSGAVAAGRSELSIGLEKKSIPFRQALAAVGQGLLMKTYHDFFAKRGMTVAQALLTNYDFSNQENFINTKNVFDLLLQRGIVPIVNENDVTATAELKFGDNDMLSAKTAAMVGADYLIILTDVDGLFSDNPFKNPTAKLIPFVKKIDDKIRRLAKGARSAHSTGGMTTKISAAEYITSSGIPMFIVKGRKKGILNRVLDRIDGCGSCGTFFAAAQNRTGNRKQRRQH